MRKYLFSTLPSNDLGLLTRSLPIARALAQGGDHVAFISPGKAPSRLIADAGFTNLRPRWATYSILSGNMALGNLCRLLTSGHIRQDLRTLRSYVRHVRNRGTAEVWNVDHFMYLMGMDDETYIREAVDTLVRMIEDYAPDAVVDFWNPCMCMAARITGVPLISVIQADMHPQSDGFIWWKQPSYDLPTPVPAVNTVLGGYGLPSVDKVAELLVGDLTMVVGTPETDPLPRTADVTYIGPILWEKQDEKLPEWIDEMGRPLIWLYAGNLRYMPGEESPFDSMAIVDACIEALADTDYQVVLSTGHQTLPRDILPLPANFRHVDFVPGLAMAARSDLMIHHGGYGSCQTGLYTGTPALIIPTFSERESNARRVAALGAGALVLPVADETGRTKRIDPAKIQETVEHIMTNKFYKENAISIGRRMQRYGGAEKAARSIASFVSAPGNRDAS